MATHGFWRLAVCVGAFTLPTVPAAAQSHEPDARAALDSLLAAPVTSAAKYVQTAREAPASVTVVTADDIERHQYRTLGELLADVRGFYTTYDRNYLYLGSRGFSRPSDYNNRVLLLVDGHALNDNFYDGAVVGTDFGLALDAVERVEVVRGPGSALYGSSAMFAVVNVVTKSGLSLQGVHTSAELESGGRRRGSVSFGHGRRDGVDASLAATWLDDAGRDLYFPEFDDPTTNAGMAEGRDWDRALGVLGAIRYRGISLSTYVASREKGIPTAPWETLFNTPARTLDRRAYVEVRGEKQAARGKLMSLRLAYDHYRYEGVYPYEPPDGDEVDRNDSHWLTGEAQLRWDVAPGDRLQVGVEYRQHLEASYHARTDLGTYFDGDFPFSVVSVYAQNDWQLLPELALVAGARLDHYSTTGSALSPRGGIVFHPAAGTALKALYGEAFRAPNRYEADYETPGFDKANPALRPERVRTLELVWEQRLTAGLFSVVSLYDYRVRDLISQVTDPADGLSQFQNIDAVTGRGAEVEVRAELGAALSAQASYVLQETRDATTDALLTNSPKHLVRARAAYTIARGPSVTTSWQYDHDRLTVQGTTTAGYVLGDVSLSSGELLGPIRVTGTVRNVFDRSYRTPAGWEHVQDGIVQDGRTFGIRVDVRP